MQLYEYQYEGAARRFFRRWYFWATHSRLKPMISVAHTLRSRFPNIITFLKHHSQASLSSITAMH